MDKKTCTKCNQEKSINDFEKNRTVCKTCINKQRNESKQKKKQENKQEYKQIELKPSQEIIKPVKAPEAKAKCDCCFSADEINQLKELIKLDISKINFNSESVNNQFITLNKANRERKSFNIDKDLIKKISKQAKLKQLSESEIVNQALYDYFKD